MWRLHIVLCEAVSENLSFKYVRIFTQVINVATHCWIFHGVVVISHCLTWCTAEYYHTESLYVCIISIICVARLGIWRASWPLTLSLGN